MIESELYKAIAEASEKNEISWLVTVTNVTGSTPARIGMKMIIYSDGSIKGTIGGGEIEKLIIEKIIEQRPEKAEILKYNLGTNDTIADKTNMECGGVQEVLAEPLFTGSLLYIVGGGHCGMALSETAYKTGFSPVIIDNREEWANKLKHPFATKTICAGYNDVENHITFSDKTYIVIMTHGHKHDELVLRKLINHKYKYLGMIGSNRKVKIVLENLLKEGFDKNKIAGVFSPIGFDIGSHTPAEVAVAILAQLVAVKYDRNKINFNSNPINL